MSESRVDDPTQRPLPQRLLGVWAHPDDECYLSAGLMARVIAAGGAVRIVCATRGEFGSSDPDEMGTASFGRFRELELRSSLAVLGVHDVTFLELADGGCADADDTRMSEIVASHIEDFGADVVVTFGPDGITNHPDHLAVSRWSTAAVARVAGTESSTPAVELLYATMTDDFVDRHRDMHDELGLFGDHPDGQPRSVPDHKLAMKIPLHHGELIRKRRALAEHRSQTAPLAAAVGEDFYFSWWHDECFRQPTWAEVFDAIVAAAGPVRVGSRR
jgi:LmbE family N-acetylglucosaminyl deacetylase